jgi:hypothetical protein
MIAQNWPISYQKILVKTPQLVGILVLKKTPQLVGILVELPVEDGVH